MSSVCGTQTKPISGQFVTWANHYHDTIKFTAEISDSEITFLETKVYKGERFNKDSTLDVQRHYKQIETFQYRNFYSCHPPGVKKVFIKGEALRLLRTNSSHLTFNKNMQTVIEKDHLGDWNPEKDCY